MYAHPVAQNLSFISLDTIERLAHEWFDTRGVANEEQTERNAVKYTRKWVPRSARLTPAGRVAARRHLLDNRNRSPEYRIPLGCITAQRPAESRREPRPE